MQDKVSIITPSWNSEKYIADTIKSVQNQTYSNWEMIIVDDNSTDHTVDINNQYGNQIAELDIYGPIDEEYAFKFNELIETNKGIVNYKGCINANQSVEAIKNYYALLFPTRYFNEGIPGTIIDAFAAGVPVIARKWHYCDEMVSDKVNGLVYDFDKPEMLVETMCFAINHSELMNKMKINCLKKSREYKYESVKLQIADSIKNKGK